jgi:uncharacterized repeat protein (TIGR01451 family)
VPRQSGSSPLNLRTLALAFAVGFSLFVLPAEALGQGWYDSNWQYRKRITIDNTMVAGDLTDFPVLLDFTDTDLRDKARNDGWDILFTADDGTTKLDHDFEAYDGATGALIVWVEVQNLSGSVDTDIYMYYGYATVPSSQENETGTWGNGYEAVYHLHNGSFADATGNHNATNSGSATATGIAGDGRNFVRSEDDYVDTGWNPSLTGDFTFEGWFRALGQTSSGDIWGVEDRGSGDNSEIRLAIRDTDANNSADGYNLEIKADAAGDISEEGALPGDPDDGNWHHIALVRESATGRLYYDGSYITLNDSLTTSGTAGFPVSLLMGAQWDTDGGGPPAVRNLLNGDLDETRVSTVLRTGDYFATQVANVNNSAPGGFYDFLSGEESAGLIGHWNFNEGSGQVAADASPSNNDGTLGLTTSVESGDPTWACSGTALEFDGSDDEVKLSSVAIGDRAAWSISAWIKMGPDAADKRTIYGEGDTTQREYLYLDVAEAGSYVTFYSEDFPGTVYTQLDGTTNVEDDAWHLVTVVQRSKTDRVLYVDGTPEDSSTQNAGTLVFNTASIGYLRSEGWVADPFLGTIDDVRIYDYALSTAEIATLYANPPGACGAAAGDVVMMLVADAVTRDPVDDSLAAYLEAQGLTVVFADDNLTGAQIEDSINAYGVDVMYVSQTCGSSNVDDIYLTNLNIGIVMPNVGNWDGFELANHDGVSTGPTVGYVADNSHYITQPFSTGDLTLYSSATPLGYGDMGFGSGADVLMHVPGDPTTGLIVAYEAGATLETGNPADGRRVGLFTEGEDWGYFTADTKTLIYRSILWGGGLAGGAGSGDAVTSATAEISPNDVTTNDTNVEFIYAILATIGGTDTGVDRVTITVPNSFGLPTVDSLRVGGTAVTFTDNTAARLISIDLDTKLTSTDSIQVYFTADAPTLADATGQDFTSTVDDSGTGAAAQSTTEGNADGDAGDNNSWTVTTTDSGGGGGPTPPGGICPAFDAVSSDTTITNSLTISHTTAGPERLMLVGVSINNDNIPDTVTSATYNGVPLSRYGTYQRADDARVEIWQLVGPDTGTHNVVVTFGGVLTHGAVAGVLTVTGVDQAVPLGTFAGNETNSNLATVDVPAAVGDMVFALMSGETVTSVTTNPPANEQWNLNTLNGSDEFGAAAIDSATATTVTFNWSLGSADHWAAGGVAIKASSACLNAVPSISSAANQTFQVGDPTTAASTITIAEDTLYQTISDTDDLRVRIPSGLDMIWDTLQATIVVGGNASSKVSTTVTYEDAGKTAVIDVTTSFAALDTITVDSLKFMDFGSVSAADSLELEVKNDGLVSAVDDKTKEITVGTPAVTSATAEIAPNDVPTSSTGNEFTYAILATISGPATGVDSVAITVPATFGDPTVDSVKVGGTAVTYTDNTAGKLISIILDTKVTSTDSIQVYFASDAPGSADPTGQDFTSAVDDTATSDLPQATTEGNADGDAGDSNSWTVTTTDPGSATLLGRYWFNEAPSGQVPTTVYDDQPSPVNLTTIVYDSPVEWTVADGHRGLNGASDPHSGIAYGTASGTKYTTNLDGALEATFVAVAEWAPAAGSQRIASFVTDGGTRVAELVPLSGDRLSFRVMTQAQSLTVTWDGAPADSTRRVFHLVYDADNPVDSLRLRLYVDGSLLPPPTLTSGTWPGPAEGLDFSAANILLTALNNTPGDAMNPLNGTVFYYAVYAGMLTDGEISTNTTALLADDDSYTPTVSVTPDGLGSPVLRPAGTDYSQSFAVTNNSTLIDDFDLFTSVGPAPSFLTVDSITGANVTQGADPDSARLTGVASGATDSVTVWYTVASSTDGRVDTLYIQARSITDTTETDSGYAEVEFDLTVTGTPLVRYWIDEAPSGQGVANLIDSESNPINMPLTYVDSVPYFAGDHGGYRHLRFNGPDNTDTGGGLVDVGGTKMDAVHGSTVVTIEAKYAFEPGSACTGQDERIFGISEDRGSAFGQLQIRGVSGAHTLSVMWAGVGTVYRYALTGGCNLTSASVVHWVVDTNEATDSDRVRAYVGGVRQTVTVATGAWPSAGATIDLGAVGTRKMYVGRPYSGLATLKGRIWYVALYLGELSDALIASNASALGSSDDDNTYAVNVTPDGATVVRQPGTEFSQAFTVTNNSSVLEDFDLLARTGPASSFITIDSITVSMSTGVPDSARVTGIAASGSEVVTVWYTVASSTDGRIDTLFLRARSTSNPAELDDGWLEVEFDQPTLTPLVRYWVDEAPSGQGVANLIDAESNPLNMPLNYPGTSPYWAGDSGGNRHLRFSGAGDTGGGVVDTDGTKMDAVHGATQVTIEVKYMMDGGGTCSNNGERIFGLSDGDVSTSGWLAVRERAGRDVLQVQWQGQTVGVYALETGCPITGASVVHWVVDTTEPVAADRIRAYIDGVQATVTAVESTSLPSQNETIDLGPATRRMFVGRPNSGFRNFSGRIWYAALYVGEMSDANIASNATALLAMDDNNTYDVTVTPDGTSVVRLAGTDYSYAFTLNNGSSVLEDIDLLASTDPASSFITIDSITGGGISDSGVADSTRIYGVDASADSTVTVWYTIAADSDGNIDTLYLRGRSISDTAQSDLGWIEIEYEAVAFTVTPDGADTLQLMPTGTAASSSYKFTITNNSALSETFDLLAFDGTVLTVDSITGPNVSGGSPGDSARTGAIAASAEDSAFVWFTISVGTAGALDSLYLMGRSVSEPSATDSGWVFVELLQPGLVTSKVANPNGTQPPGTDLTYTLTITNNGTADGVNVVTVDSLAAEVYFQVGSVVTTLPTGMTDSIEYYDGCGSDGWSYTPVSSGGGAPAGYDACAVRIRWTLLNDFSYVAPDNTADLEFVARIK